VEARHDRVHPHRRRATAAHRHFRAQRGIQMITLSEGDGAASAAGVGGEGQAVQSVDRSAASLKISPDPDTRGRGLSTRHERGLLIPRTNHPTPER
jgi:hypothetical protein